MATMTTSDPLLALRLALSSASTPPQLTTTSSPTPTTDDLTAATHLYLPTTTPHQQTQTQCIPLSTPTRFISAAAGNVPIDLRSIYFAWLKRDVTIQEYIASAQAVNEVVADGSKVLNLVFVERLDLITWLEGASEDSEYIKPLEGEAGIAGAAGAAPGVSAAAQAAEDSAKVASGAAGGVPAVASAAAAAGVAGSQAAAGAAVGGRPVRSVDPRLQEIYNGERKMGDRNSVLRGIRPTDFSHVRKTAEMFLGRNRSRPGQHAPGGALVRPGMKNATPGAPSLLKQPTPPSSASSRRPNPIILLSPSASSLLRMSNIKSFLSDGIYVPPDHPTLATSTASNLLYITRPLQTIPDPTSSSTNPSKSSSSSATNQPRKPTRFILVDSTADFKPDYWSRVVAVFTTGQTWQFKSYKWSSPPELFKHATGIYVGWRGEEVPREVRGWGRGVKSFAIDRWDEKSANIGGATGIGGSGVSGAGAAVVGPSGRWRDRGVVEGVWMAIEEGMRARGWGK
ncbi:hypothetical protein AJ79_03988 [Helicocarpus griseus UAMH5409]|uniref:Cell division control protein 73 C-terminal domain-containing protein n=1 Tax=Helicocarpus griseus UAMH5409 TaxID=1447875 RepID=A0A2B7XWF8_9EURO|nr:hypothetical protein AJ79_03988 [Helicocarpus griseus UAMH5409]